LSIDISCIPAPCYVLEEDLLRRNLALIRGVADAAEVEIILAFKGFAMWSVFPVVREYFAGATASSLHEARLCWEEMKVRPHVYCAVILPEEADELFALASHVTFNSLSQWDTYRPKALQAGISCGIRVNPEYSEVTTEMYNPCSPHSRLGMTAEHFADGIPTGIDGLHFHALCENDSYALENTLKAFEEKFGHLLPHIKWVNMGGGHLMTRAGYDTAHLVQLLRDFKARHPHLHIILEPGSAFAWQTGYLVARVLDIVENRGVKTAMLDVSFSAHMPDCLEMPYRPRIWGATDPGADRHNYRIGGTSCLSGDFMFEYGFENPLHVGDKVVLDDMIHYTMVKTSFFNGVKHPSIGIWRPDNTFEMVRTFGYEDYKGKLS
jgi:carboxynorspermidine decarboxylase